MVCLAFLWVFWALGRLKENIKKEEIIKKKKKEDTRAIN
jgi:hypothetical protein